MLRRATTLAPALAGAWNDLGVVLSESGPPGPAIEALRQGMAGSGGTPMIAANLAGLLAGAGEVDEALGLLDTALRQHPADHGLHWTRGLIALSLGRFEEGWAGYAHRWDLPPALFDGLRRDFALPVAPSGPQTGALTWLWPEQGLGDEILFASVLADAISAGWSLRAGCTPRLLALFRRSFPDVDIVAPGTGDRKAAQGCEAQMPAGDLAARLRRSWLDFGSGAAFLRPDPTMTAGLRQRYAARLPGQKLVGLSWRSANRFSASAKSPPLDALLPILRVPGCAFVSLQYGAVDPDLARLQHLSGATIIADTEINPLGDLDPLAAQIAALDAVVSVSNTNVHLAGALGVPAAVLLPAQHGLMWYWFRQRTDSPWYRSLTLFRQPVQGAWQEPVAAAAAWLAACPVRAA